MKYIQQQVTIHYQKQKQIISVVWFHEHECGYQCGGQANSIWKTPAVLCCENHDHREPVQEHIQILPQLHNDKQAALVLYLSI